MIWKHFYLSIIIACFIVGLANCSQGNDRNGVHNVPVPAGRFTSPSWSSDGQFVVLQFHPKSGSIRNEDIVVMRPDGSDLRILSTAVKGNPYITSPQMWCNDKIGFRSSDLLPNPSVDTLKSIGFDGSGEQIMLDGIGEVTSVAWDSRNCRVAFETKDTGGLSHLVVFDPSSKSKQEILVLPKDMWFEDIEWSRSGERIAYTIVRKFRDRNSISYLEVLDINTNARQIFD